MMGSSSSRRLDGTTTCSPHDGREEVDVPRVDSEEEVGIPREYAESWLDITMLGLAGDVVGDICNVAPHVSGRQLVKFVAVSAGFPSWEVRLIFKERQLDQSQSLLEQLAVEGVTLGQGGTGIELQIVRRAFDWDGKWTITWMNGKRASVQLSAGGTWRLYGHSYALQLDKDPVQFRWNDGTVQSVIEFAPPRVTWSTTHSEYPKIFWEKSCEQ
eukprot:TRINITY_DN10883_c0_g1_i2.p1 TRINITY_DN10883_c0_g1~~TRINITY_DN10883_c0_g1_i2.p1  ORF type:complete len:214 (+),score=37.20 TRINITY_DN10883_c0_g1_i2:99-740(+)